MRNAIKSGLSALALGGAISAGSGCGEVLIAYALLDNAQATREVARERSNMLPEEGDLYIMANIIDNSLDGNYNFTYDDIRGLRTDNPAYFRVDETVTFAGRIEKPMHRLFPLHSHPPRVSFVVSDNNGRVIQDYDVREFGDAEQILFGHKFDANQLPLGRVTATWQVDEREPVSRTAIIH